MKVGIIGLPSSGKTSLWSCLTGIFEQHEPSHIGKLQTRTVRVRDPRLERLGDDYKPKKLTSAAVEISDFPPMARDRADRAGIAQLLAPARLMDLLIAVLRGFEDPVAPPGKGRAVPREEWEEIWSELLLSDLVIVENRIEKLKVQVKKPSPTRDKDQKELELLQRVQAHLEEERDLVQFPLKDGEEKLLSGFQFLSLKPKVPLLNRAEDPLDPDVLDTLKERAGCDVFAMNVQNELEILQLPEEDQETFRKEFGVPAHTVDRIISECYRAASRISFFTVSEKEVRAWTIRQGDTALMAAGAVHTDMARGFIRAETLSFEDYIRYGGVKGAREKGHLRLEGKEYIVQDGDVIQFRFNP